MTLSSPRTIVVSAIVSGIALLVSLGLLVLDFLANAEVETLDSVLPAFIKILREKHPSTPIVLMSCPGFDQRFRNSQLHEKNDRRRDIAMRVYLDLKAGGDRALHYIDGHGLLPGGSSGAYVDGVHPTSHGFALMAERLAPQLRAIRLQTEF